MTKPKTFLAAAPPPAAPAGPREILELQRRLTEEGSNLAMVNAKAKEIEGEIATLKTSTPPLPNFDAPRESLLADVALDKATKDDLKRFDQEAAAAKMSYDATVNGIREKVSPLEATVAGLRRKAAIHNRTIEGLRAEHRRICLEYLLEQAEIAGKEYADAITRAVKAMDLCIVFASLHKRAGGTNRIGEDIGALDVPPLGTASTRGVLPALYPASRATAYDAAEAAILESLRAEGIAVPFPNVDVLVPAKARVPGIGEGTPVTIMRPAEPLRFPDGCLAPPQAVTEPEE